MKKGFTLIELIVTIAILAILLTIVVVAINPAEQLARSRDAKRIADLDALRSAWNLYLAQASTTVDLSGHASYTCKGEGGSNVGYFMARTTGTSTPSGFNYVVTSTVQTVGASGWAPARIDQTPGGVPISNLPVDPRGFNTTEEFWYAYACDQTAKSFEFTARFESNYFKTDLDNDGIDGGNSSSTYEAGTDLTLVPVNY